ncbi:hypothetical protein OPKNFCMD_6621 [Methylobacterium crusticola]|uniref:DUF4148 domain-containing protein n=1 Tax=Methylobacterium crusticola TaxID=1697972 RepID=A0ABQ4RAW5_9HYPH|nr:hypothetical protein [Methylobacterium crusticola]GJD53842.1 hypothetical protein OPKNFCMD_6621 [Methylobacterium crusticola]
MTKTILLLAGTMALVATAAAAQTAKENFSYKAPSGMFSEGTTKWDMYRFMHQDAERQRELARSGVRDEPAATGSVRTTSPAARRSGTQ